MDYGGYRAGTRLNSGRPVAPTVPVTMSTGIPLTERFTVMQEQRQVLKSFAQEGYGLPGMGRYGGIDPTMARRAKIAQQTRASALALARQPMRGGMRGLPNRNRGRPSLPVRARLGINRKQQPVPLLRRRGGNQIDQARGPILNRIQKTGGAIMRKRGAGALARPLRAKPLVSVMKSTQQRGNANVASRGRGGARGGMIGRGGGRGRGGARGGGGARGRGGARGGGRPGVNTSASKPSRDDLDTELDEYMSKSKSYLDKELDSYMSQKKAEAAAVSAGVVTVEDADVNMTE